jgi:predicted permease
MKPDDGFRRSFRLGEHSPDVRRDVEDELSFYLEMRARELMAQGVPREEAQRRAREAFGDERRIARQVEGIAGARMRRWRVHELAASFGQDVRFGVRGLVRTPAFALAAVLTLALGIGANTMVFGLLEAALLRAPAVRSPETLAAVYTTCRQGEPRCSSSYPDYEDYRARAAGIADIAVHEQQQLTLGDGVSADVVTAELVTGNYFEVLGVGAARGRAILPEDDAPGGDQRVAVLSHAIWRTRFGGDPGTVGATVRLNGVPYAVIGVAPPSFKGLRLGRAPSMWVPLHGITQLFPSAFDAGVFDARNARWMSGLVARLEEGVSVERARAGVLALSAQLAREDSAARGPRTVTVDPLPGYVLPAGSEATISAFLIVLQGVVGFTLLLACANLTNLLLARGSARRRELSVRAAIGAGRARLVRQLLTESLVLAAAGGAAGLGLAALCLSLISGFQLPFGFDVGALGTGINARVALFTAGLAVATVAVFGTLPALHTTRGDLALVLRQARTGGPRAGRLLGSLVGVQVALCVVLLAGAGLFLRTLDNHLRTDLGFRAKGVALLTIDPSMNRYTPGRTQQLVQALTVRAAALPGVEVTSTGTRVPLLSGGAGTFVQVEGYAPAPDEEMRVEYNFVGPDYLRTLGIPLRHGRDISAGDGFGGQRVAVINEKAARTWWADRDPVGGTITFGGEPHTVIGIAGDAAWQTLEVGGSPFVYVPMSQNPAAMVGPRITLIARTSAARVQALLPAMRAVLHEIDPGLAVSYLGSMEETVATTLAPQRGVAVLLSSFALLALALASVGIYGVVAYSVVQRRRDFGIRLALGARRGVLLAHVARGMTVPVAAGVAAGLLAAAALGRTIRGLIFGVQPTDPLTLLATVGILFLAAAAATLIPARRAARSDPLEIVRAE